MTYTTTTKPASLKGWIVLGLLMSVSIDFYLEFYTARILLSLFLPLVTAVVAHRFGIRVFDFLFVIAVPAILSVSLDLTSSLVIGFDIAQWSFLLSIVTAFLFCRPPIQVPIQKIINQRWRWSRWLLIVAVWLMLHSQANLEFGLGDSASIRFGTGSVLLVFVLAISVQWNEIHLQFGKVLSLARSRFGCYVRIVIALLLGVAMLVSVYVDVGNELYISFGFSDRFVATWPLAFAFCVVAFGVVDWRLAIVVAVVMLTVEDNMWRLYEYLETLVVVQEPLAVAEEPAAVAISGTGIENVIVKGSYFSYFRTSNYWFNVIYTVSFILMAVALCRCFVTRDPESLRSSHSLTFLTLSTGLLFVAAALSIVDLWAPGFFVLATLAFGIGYRWRMRGILLGPIILQLTYLMCTVLATILGYYPRSSMQAIDVGLISFMAAFFGMLLNRYSPEAPGVEMPGRQST